MDCPIPNELQNRIISFTANYTLSGPFSGTVVFSDTFCEDRQICEEICVPIEISIDGEGSVVCCPSAPDPELVELVEECFAVSPKWINGLLKSYGRNDARSQHRITSYFDYLNTKPIGTQQFCGTDLQTVFDTIFNFYAGVNDDLLCIESFDNNTIKGPVEGNNTWAELQSLAQAGCAHMFVQVGGCLTIEKWKDHTDEVEFTIPSEALVDANRADFDIGNTTIIRARGASISTTQCGDQILSNNQNGQGSTKKCVISGVPTPCASITLNNLSGDEADILSATVVSQFGCSNGRKINVKDGVFTTDVFLVDRDNPDCLDEDGELDCEKIQEQIEEGDLRCVQLFDTTPRCVDTTVVGTISQDEGPIAGFEFGPNGGSGHGASGPGFFNWFQNITNSLFPVPYSGLGFGAYGSQPFINNGQNAQSGSTSNQQSFQQCETVAIHPEIGSCGLGYDDYSNKYIFCKQTLFKMAVRRYQEILLAANTWNVEVRYLPCLKLNQKVRFTTYCTEECGQITVEGIIGGINVVREIDSEGRMCTKMRLAISDTSCLGQTEYTSGNLVQTMCAGENSGDLSGWVTSALGIDVQATSQNSGLLIAAFGAGVGFANYTLDKIDEDCEYQWEFRYETLVGSGPLFFNAPGIINGLLVGSGVRSGTFTGSNASETWSWIVDNPTLPTQVRIDQFRITKTVVA